MSRRDPVVRRLALRYRIVLAGILTAAGLTAWQAWSSHAPVTAALSLAQIYDVLPRGSLVHSLTHLEIDGRPPGEAAVVGVIPRWPGSSESTYIAFVFGYDRRDQRVRILYSRPVDAPVSQPADAIRLGGAREAAIFSSLHDDGTLSYRVVGMSRSVHVLHEGRLRGRLIIADTLLIEGGEQRRALGWNGKTFTERPLPAALPASSQGITWRYRVHNGAVFARASVAHLRPRQTLQLSRGGGGLIPIILPDQRLDVIGADVYRARYAGIYTIDILVPFTAPGQTHRLTLIVE